MISPLTNERKYGDVSTADFNTLGASVVSNTGDISTVEGRLTTTEGLTSVNTTNISGLNTALGTKASTTLVGTKASTASVTALSATVSGISSAVSLLPSVAAVDAQIITKNIAQDAQNFITYSDRATTYTKTEVDTAVSAKAPQATTYTKTEVDSAIAAGGGGGGYTDSQIDAFLAAKASAATQTNIIAGTQTLAALDVSGTGFVGGSLQAAQLHSTGPVTGQTFGAFGPTSLWSGNNPLTGDLFAQRLRVTGDVLCASLTQSSPAAPAAGTVLNYFRQDVSSAGNLNIPVTQGVLTQVCGCNYQPVSSTSYLMIDFVGVLKMTSQDSTPDGEYKIELYVGSTAVGHTIFSAGQTRESGSTSPVYGKFTNTSTSAVSLIVKAGQLHHGATNPLFFNGVSQNAWINCVEIQR